MSTAKMVGDTVEVLMPAGTWVPGKILLIEEDDEGPSVVVVLTSDWRAYRVGDKVWVYHYEVRHAAA